MTGVVQVQVCAMGKVIRFSIDLMGPKPVVDN